MENLSLGSNFIGVCFLLFMTSGIFLILVTYELAEDISRITKNMLIIMVVVLFSFVSYSNIKINKLANKDKILKLANREEVLKEVKYISKNEALEGEKYTKTNAKIIIENDTNIDNEDIAKVEAYSLNKIYKINDNLCFLDKLSFKFLNMFIDLNEFEHIETINNYAFKILVSNN